MTEMLFIVSCTPVLPADVPAVATGVLEVSIEEVSVADAPSHQIACSTWTVRHPAPGPIGPYTIEGRFINPRGRHSVRVTLDVDADNRIGVGDLLSVQSHPVRPGVQSVQVPLSRINR